jgi:rare lipoprotein A
MSASESVVAYGKPVRLSGAVPGIQNAAVEIAFRRAGGSEWSPVSNAKTDPAGSYSVQVRPRGTGEWRAQTNGGTPSQAQRIEVRSRTSAHVRHHVLSGRRIAVSGRVRPSGALRRVRVRVGGRTLSTHTRRNGAFSKSWTVPHPGHYRVRAFAGGNRIATASRSGARKVTAYRRAAASWYGPGLYGGHLACGGTLSPSTLGVANRTLRCGTKLTLRYHGRSVNARVIDRGPYAGNREFDLTAATKRRLGFPSTGTVLSSR